MVRSHHLLCVGLIFYEIEGGLCRWLSAARRVAHDGQHSDQFHKILTQHVVDDEISPLTRSCILYVTTRKALLIKNLMMASYGRNM